MSSAEWNGRDSKSDVLSNCIPSILDTDLYKLTMQQAVLRFYPASQVSYKFTNRSSTSMRFTPNCISLIKSRISQLSTLSLTSSERGWLESTCPYLRKDYLNFLEAFRYDPENQVQCQFIPDQGEDAQLGDLSLEVKGLWKDVILYEVPLMAIVSQSYFESVDKDWKEEGTKALALQKSSTLTSSGVLFSEFGTRRRRSYSIQKSVIEGLLEGIQGDGKLLGTSNVHFAHLFGLNPIGTVAHEWTMALAALGGYEGANSLALKTWDSLYSPPSFVPQNPGQDLTIALTDTFSTSVFWREIMGDGESRERLKRWRGVRQDSGDSKEFAKMAKKRYEELGVESGKKVVIYSDGLDVDRCLELQKYSREIGIGAGFGIGTNLTNDFQSLSNPLTKSKPLNIVIKLSSINDLPVVKISDDLTKNTGDEEEVRMVKRRFGLGGEGEGERIEDA